MEKLPYNEAYRIVANAQITVCRVLAQYLRGKELYWSTGEPANPAMAALPREYAEYVEKMQKDLELALKERQDAFDEMVLVETEPGKGEYRPKSNSKPIYDQD